MQVDAAGVNRLDLIQVSGRYPPPQGESDILGVEGELTETLALIQTKSSLLLPNLLRSPLSLKLGLLDAAKLSQHSIGRVK